MEESSKPLLPPNLHSPHNHYHFHHHVSCPLAHPSPLPTKPSFHLPPYPFFPPFNHTPLCPYSHSLLCPFSTFPPPLSVTPEADSTLQDQKAAVPDLGETAIDGWTILPEEQAEQLGVEEEGEPVFILTDEWIEFFAKSDAKRRLGSPDKAKRSDPLKKTLQVSNLSPLLTAEQLKQLFSYCGTVVECSITDSKHFAYIEYSKPEEATAALALNNMDVGGRPLNVEMAKSLPSRAAINFSMNQSSLLMQQAVAMQQMQFQQALLMEQTMASQQAASRAATMKSAIEMASCRAAEIRN